MCKLQVTLPSQVRCAVYTRKSTSEGLDHDFNSLDAQREAAQAFIASQAHEGWICLPTRYDDGGFSGASIDRPALKRLLADIEAGQIDCVLTYKVDRLSRSLLDFAKLMETFDKHQVSFVSVTQQFNTAQSMGRLVLNVLLSFAQFEREIISERTRDKMAATRRKGKWTGGRPLLGYDLDPLQRRLVVNEHEARRIRDIFTLFLNKQSLWPVVSELHRRGWRHKAWTTRAGVSLGRRIFVSAAPERSVRRDTQFDGCSSASLGRKVSRLSFEKTINSQLGSWFQFLHRTGAKTINVGASISAAGIFGLFGRHAPAEYKPR